MFKLVFLLHLTLSLAAFAHGAFSFWAAFDPSKITVESETEKAYAELPSGDFELKDYRAPYSVIEKYSRLHNVEKGDAKDFALAPDCTRAEIDVMRLWTTNEIYRDVNNALRLGQKGFVNGNPISEKTETEALVLASAINCAPQYEGEAVRFEKTPSAILEQYKPTNLLLMRGFTATTKGKEIPPSLSHQGFNVEIILPRVRGADIERLGISAWHGEKEVLLRPGTVFKVIDRKDLPSTEKITQIVTLDQRGLTP